jgi:hypothetical protein
MSAIWYLRRIRRVGGQNEVANNGERAVGAIRQPIKVNGKTAADENQCRNEEEIKL